MEGLERWVLRGGLFILPLAYSWSTYDAFVLPKLLVARALVIALAAAVVARALTRRELALKRSSLDLPLLVFLGSALVSTALAYNVNVAVFGTYSRYDGLLTTLTYLALFWLTLQALRGPGDARALVRVLLASGYVVALLAIVQSVHDSSLSGGVKPGFGTLGNQNVTGAFLAMLCPLAVMELVASRSWTARLLSLNALVMLALALILTLSRSAWLGAGAAAFVLAVGGRGRVQRFGLAAGLVAVGGLVVVSGLQAGGLPLGRFIEQRVVSAFSPASWGPRPHIWQDSLPLIASRPVFGYGPDNFGLVYPRFQTGKWAVDATGFELQIDKAHAETLQVAATQGLVGLGAYLFLLGAFGRSFWRGRRNDGALAVFAAWIGYQVTVQLNFTALPSAFPFWIMAAAAVQIWERPQPRTFRVARPLAIGVSATIALAALVAVAVALPFVADFELARAVEADFSRRAADAASSAETARILAPFESVYATEAGNIAFERNDWVDAASAYEEATALGSYNPRLFRNLALAERNLGRRADALAAARQAALLDRFDPANQALVDQLSAQGP